MTADLPCDTSDWTGRLSSASEGIGELARDGCPVRRNGQDAASAAEMPDVSCARGPLVKHLR